MAVNLSVTFTGLQFRNPFLLSSAPPTESESNILRAFDAGWGGVVTKTIGLHPVINVKGPKTKFLRADSDSYHLSMQKRPGTALHSSWNWELISDKTLDWWIPRIERIKSSHPDRILVASIMAGSGSDRELSNWQTLATACQDAGADAFELNLSCPHMDRKDMGSNIGKDQGLISVVTQVVKEVSRVPVWCKLTPSTTDIVAEARASLDGGADAIVSSNTFPSLPLIDPDSLEFEMNVEGYVSSGGLGGPAILPLSIAKIAQLTSAFPSRQLLGHRRHRRLYPCLELFPAGMRNGAGLHGRHARPRHRAKRDQGADDRDDRVPRSPRLGDARRLSRSQARSRRLALTDQAAGGEGIFRRARNRGGLRGLRKMKDRRRKDRRKSLFLLLPSSFT